MTARTFRWIRSGALPGARNMALDEALLLAAPAPAPALRVYRWRPWTLSLGWFQRVEPAEVAPFLAAGHAVTRRATGGGAIFHGDEVTYSLVLPLDDPRLPGKVADAYHWIHGAVAEALAECGVATAPRDAGAAGGDAAGPVAGPDPFFCFARTASIDLVAGGRKLVGSAQRRTSAGLLQHGSIPLTATGGAPGATSVAGVLGRPADGDALEEALGRAFSRLLRATAVPGSPTEEEEERASAAERLRFGNPAWVLHPWKGRGPSRRHAGEAGAGLAPPPPPPPEPPAVRVLRASVTDGALVVEAVAGGGRRPALPHAALRSAALVEETREEGRPLSADRDPWDSTFRRSLFEGSGEGEPPVTVPVRETTCLLRLRYDGGATAEIDGRRFNYAALGPRRTGRWREDLAALVGLLAARCAPGILDGVLRDLGPPPGGGDPHA